MKKIISFIIVMSVVLITASSISSANLGDYIVVVHGDRSTVWNPDGSGCTINCSSNQTVVCYYYYDFPQIPGTRGWRHGIYLPESGANPQGAGTGYVDIENHTITATPNGSNSTFSTTPETEEYQNFEDWQNAIEQ
jgi:hypothetical protein